MGIPKKQPLRLKRLNARQMQEANALRRGLGLGLKGNAANARKVEEAIRRHAGLGKKRQ